MTSTTDQPTEPAPFRVLAVCTANVCRSPMMGALLRHVVSSRLGPVESRSWRIATAGTEVRDGWATSTTAVEVLERRSIRLRPRPARQASMKLLASADLVLTAERTHRAWIVRQNPALVHRTFTLLQFTRLCAAGLADHPTGTAPLGPSLLSAAQAGRSRLQPASDAVESLSDPMGSGRAAFEECADRIEAALQQIFLVPQSSDGIRAPAGSR